jgi:hypothetical protein
VQLRSSRQPAQIFKSDTIDPETLTLHTYDIIPDQFPNGDECAHVRMYFKYRSTITEGGSSEEFGWNGYISPGTSTYYRVRRKSSTSDDPFNSGYKGLFPLTDFAGLFEPEPA